MPLVLATVALVAGGGTATASVLEPKPPEQGVGPFSQEFRENQAEAMRAGKDAPDPADKNDKATPAKVRESRTEHEGEKTASEVRELVKDVAPTLLAHNAIVPPASEVEEALNPTTLALKDQDGKPGGLVTSNMPLAVSVEKTKANPRGLKIADLGFDRDGDRIDVTRARVPVSLPADADGTTKFGALGMQLAPGADDSTASLSGDTVTYPNTTTDRDVIVRATGAGVSAAWVLRSPDASRTIRVPLDLPDGASLKRLKGGAVEIRDRDDDQIGAISIPIAKDSGGNDVPLTVDTDDDTLTITAKPDEAKTAWPLVIDPDFQAKWNQGTNGFDGDFANWTAAKLRAATPLYTGKIGGGSSAGASAGLYVNGYNGDYGPNGYMNGDYASWNRYAPGDTTAGVAAGDRAYWYRFDIGGVDYTNQLGAYGSTDPQAAFGLLNPNGTGQVTKFQVQSSATSVNNENAYSGVAQNGAPRALPSGTANYGARIYSGTTPDITTGGVPNNIAAFSLQEVSPYGGNRPQTSVHLGWYRLYAADGVDPTFSGDTATVPKVYGSTSWTDDPPATIDGIAGIDRGMGIRSIDLLNPAGDKVSTYAPTCVPAGRRICPFTTPATSLATGDVPEGRNTYKVKATDGGGRLGTRDANLYVDTTAPDLTLSGDLYDQRTTTLPAGQTRPLTINTADGDPTGPAATQRSGVQRVEIYVDDELVKTYDQPTAGDSRPLNVTWTPDSDTFSGSTKTVRVEATDRLGHDKTASFAVTGPCCSTAPASNPVSTNGRLSGFGDVDGDGNRDIVLVDMSSGAIAVRPGNGSGAFGAETSWGSFGGAVAKIAVGDFDGSNAAATTADSDTGSLGDQPGGADIAATTSGGDLRPMYSNGSQFVGLTAAQTADLDAAQTTWPTTRGMNVADLDGDEVDDLWGIDPADGGLFVAKGTDSGFITAERLATVPQTRGTALVDLDGDKMADLVTYEPSDGTVRWHPSDGNAFGDTATFGTGPTNADIAGGDVNGDGLQDIVFRRAAGSSGAGQVLAKQSSASEGFISGSLDLGTLDTDFDLFALDLSGDTRADVVGTKTTGNTTDVRFAASNAPDPQEVDPTPEGTEDDPAPGSGFASRSAVAVKNPELMAQDDGPLLQGTGLPGGSGGDSPLSNGDATRGRGLYFDQLRSLGVEKLRFFVYWGQVDRYHPNDSLESAGTGTVAIKNFEGATPTPQVLVAASASDEVDPRPGASSTIKQRYLFGPLDKVLSEASIKGFKIHLTITGGTRNSFTECNDRIRLSDPTGQPNSLKESALGARGCQGRGSANTWAPTGLNPSPAQFGHFVAEATRHFKGLLGSKLESIGIWNEPNGNASPGTPGGFLTVVPSRSGGAAPTTGVISPTGSNAFENAYKRSERKTGDLYGRLYASAYSELDSKNLLGGVAIGFGELASKPDRYYEADGRRRTELIDSWTSDAISSAKTAGPSSWATSGVRADGFAIHPYQHTGAPWKNEPDFQWGAYQLWHQGVVTGSAKKPRPALKSYLSTKKNGKDLVQRDNANLRPQIWATEFGYQNTHPTNKNSLSSTNQDEARTEGQRRSWLFGNAGSDGGDRFGALSRITGSTRGTATVVNMFAPLEAIPGRVTKGGDAVALKDYGFIGSANTTPANADYTYSGQFLNVNPSSRRPYNKRSDGSLSGSTLRSVGCRLAGFARSNDAVFGSPVPPSANGAGPYTKC